MNYLKCSKELIPREPKRVSQNRCAKPGEIGNGSSTLKEIGVLSFPVYEIWPWQAEWRRLINSPRVKNAGPEGVVMY